MDRQLEAMISNVSRPGIYTLEENPADLEPIRVNLPWTDSQHQFDIIFSLRPLTFDFQAAYMTVLFNILEVI